MKSELLLYDMANTDKEFYEKIDKRMTEILAPKLDIQYERGEYDYKKDKVKGDKGEAFARKFLEGNGCKFIRESSTKNDENKEFDHLYSYNGKEVKYEIKTDTYPETGNLAVEFEDRNKPSGIDVTKADYFLTCFPNRREIWNIKTDKLKKLITENEFKVVSGGDGKKAKMYLIPREQFREHFRVHEIT